MVKISSNLDVLETLNDIVEGAQYRQCWFNGLGHLLVVSTVMYILRMLRFEDKIDRLRYSPGKRKVLPWAVLGLDQS